MTTPRRRFAITAAAFGIAGLAVLPAAAATNKVFIDDAWRAQAAAVKPLGGFTLSASSSPVTTQFYEQAIPIPADPQAEVHASYSQATSSTGPSNRGLASSLWPGAAVGDGYNTIVGTLSGSLQIPPAVAGKIFGSTYPVQANTTYPAGPAQATQGNAPGPYSIAHATATKADAMSTYAGQSPIDNAAAPKLRGRPQAEMAGGG